MTVVMLAAVPTYAGECRFIRGDSVGIPIDISQLWEISGDASRGNSVSTDPCLPTGDSARASPGGTGRAALGQFAVVRVVLVLLVFPKADQLTPEQTHTHRVACAVARDLV
jgi:hypothetical protein